MPSLQQSPAFNAALACLGAAPERCADADAYILRRPWRPALVTRAGTGNASQAMALAQAGVRIINAEREGDAAALRKAGFSRILTPQHIAELTLAADEDQQLDQMHSKWRNRLRRAQSTLSKRHGLTHKSFCPTRDAWLLQAETAQQKERRYRGYPPALCVALHQVAPKALHLISLTHRKTPLAAMLFVSHGKTATYHIGWSGAEGRKAGAHPLILWHAMRALRSEGIEMLDLGSIETETNPSLARFKLGSGAGARSLGGTWARLWP